jgi:predicted nucleic acid-binding protein
MGFLVLDSGGVSALARPGPTRAGTIQRYRMRDVWPPLVPSAVLVECLTGHAGRDATANQLLKSCTIVDRLPTPIARRAAALRTVAGRGSAVDAIVIAFAELNAATVLTADVDDLRALAAHADGVLIEPTW